MDELDLWRMGETFSLTTAAALICGIRPSRVHDKNQFGDEGYSVWHGNGNDPGADHDDAPNLFLAASVKMKQIEADAHGAGHAWRTIERAKNRMHVKAYKEQKPKGKWVWCLPAEGRHDGSEDRHTDLGGGLRDTWRPSTTTRVGGEENVRNGSNP